MEPHDLVHRFAALCNAHDIAGFDSVIATDYRQHNPIVQDGLEGIRHGFAAFLEVFPDLAVTVDAVVAEGDLVSARFTWAGTHRAEFLGIAPTARTVRWTSSDWWRISGGTFAEHWDVVDWAGLTSQLTTVGAAPGPPSDDAHQGSARQPQ